MFMNWIFRDIFRHKKPDEKKSIKELNRMKKESSALTVDVDTASNTIGLALSSNGLIDGYVWLDTNETDQLIKAVQNAQHELKMGKVALMPTINMVH